MSAYLDTIHAVAGGSWPIDRLAIVRGMTEERARHLLEQGDSLWAAKMRCLDCEERLRSMSKQIDALREEVQELTDIELRRMKPAGGDERQTGHATPFQNTQLAGMNARP